jgi:hypothetical protein
VKNPSRSHGIPRKVNREGYTSPFASKPTENEGQTLSVRVETHGKQKGNVKSSPVRVEAHGKRRERVRPCPFTSKRKENEAGRCCRLEQHKSLEYSCPAVGNGTGTHPKLTSCWNAFCGVSAAATRKGRWRQRWGPLPSRCLVPCLRCSHGRQRGIVELMTPQ